LHIQHISEYGHTDLAALVVDPAYVVDPVYPFQWVLEVLKLVLGPEVPQYVVTVLVEEAVVGVVVGLQGYHCDVNDG
jgi:hypothetical protein